MAQHQHLRLVNILQWTSVTKRCHVLITVSVTCVTLIIIGHYISVINTLSSGSFKLYKTPKVSQKVFNSTRDNYRSKISEHSIQKNTTERLGTFARRFPQCIIIGAKKGGTRALVEFLSIHPRVQVVMGEVHFFTDNRKYNKGREYYRSLMPFSYENQITLEKSPTYLIHEAAARRIYEYDKNVKLIVTLRHPVKRLISDYWHVKRHHSIFRHKTLEEVVLNSTTGDINTNYDVVHISMYYIHLKRFLEYFPIKQLHVVDGDTLIANPMKEMSKIQTFLGLEHELTDENFYFDPVKGFYCYMKEKKHTCLADWKGHRHPPIDPILYQKLMDFFEPYNQKLFTLLGHSFDWK